MGNMCAAYPFCTVFLFGRLHCIIHLFSLLGSSKVANRDSAYGEMEFFVSVQSAFIETLRHLLTHATLRNTNFYIVKLVRYVTCYNKEMMMMMMMMHKTKT